MMKRLIFISLFVFVGCKIYSQPAMKKAALTAEDKLKGVFEKYKYPEIYQFSPLLLLYKNHRYKYNSCCEAWSFYSIGKWRRKNKQLFLTSDLQQAEVPVKITYVTDSSTKNGNKLSDVYDKKRSTILWDAYILINNDSTIFYPMSVRYKGTFKRIDSIKIIFADRMSTKWIKVEDEPFQRLKFTLDTDEDIPKYIPMHDKLIVFKGDSIRINWQPLPALGPGWPRAPY